MPLTEEIWPSLAMAYLLFIPSFLSFLTSVLLSGEQMMQWEPQILGKFSAGSVGWVLLFNIRDWGNRWLLTVCFILPKNEDVMLWVEEDIFIEGEKSKESPCLHHWVVASPNQQPLLLILLHVEENQCSICLCHHTRIFCYFKTNTSITNPGKQNTE